MRLPDPHQMSSASLRSVADCGAGLATVRSLALARRSRNLLVLKAVVHHAELVGHPGAPAAEQAFARLVELERVAPDAVSAVVHHPPVAAWAFRTVRALADRRGGPAWPGGMAAVAAAAAVRAGAADDMPLGAPVRWSGTSYVMLPTLGRAIVSGRGPFRLHGDEVVGNGERVRIPADPHRTVGAWQGLPRIVAPHRGREIALLLDTLESDPASRTSVAESEPFSPAAAASWQARFEQAWRLLVRHHAQVADEVAELVTVLVPLAATGSGAASATPGDAFGAVAMTLPGNPTWFALTLAHEVQHVKLTAVTDLFPLLEAEQGNLYYAPWRDDPRPLFGLLHGMYAHIGVAAFWRRQLAHSSGATAMAAEIELARWRAASREVGNTLETEARLTPAGRIFLDGMTEAVDELFAVPVSAAAADAATGLRQEHRMSWRAANRDGSTRPSG